MSEGSTPEFEPHDDSGSTFSGLNNDVEFPNDPSRPMPEDFQDINLIQMAFLVEGGLFILALVIAWFGFYDKPNPLASLTVDNWVSGTLWGLLVTVPMLGYLAIVHFGPPRCLLPMTQFVEDYLKPIFVKSSLFELALISLLAGFCEELFFRWCLQGGITSSIGGTTGVIVGLIVASVVFGACHWVNSAYGITTMIVGVYLGLAMIWTGNFLAPAIAHALFDFIALIYIARVEPKQRLSSGV